MRVVVVSGYSGAGKSTALNVLEDAGFYCIDNLPMTLLNDFIEQSRQGDSPVENLAVGIDARNLSNDFNQFPQMLENIRAQGVACEVLFLNTAEAILLKRFSENRRKHPLSSSDLSLAEAVQKERPILDAVRGAADIHIDTTNINVRELRSVVRERVVRRDKAVLSLMLMSFGFKYGAPADVDFIFDVRCLPNPHWEPSLRSLTGLDQPVADYLSSQPPVEGMLLDIQGFLERWMPAFEAENRSYVTVAIGCTGGQHRSVYFVDELHKQLKASYPQIISRHRELR